MRPVKLVAEEEQWSFLSVVAVKGETTRAFL